MKGRTGKQRHPADKRIPMEEKALLDKLRLRPKHRPRRTNHEAIMLLVKMLKAGRIEWSSETGSWIILAQPIAKPPSFFAPAWLIELYNATVKDKRSKKMEEP